jgi:hypothetical protein
LSIDVAANGRTVLVDPGTCTYTGSKELRDWFRSSHAHNTITVDGQSSSMPDGPFTWKTKAQCSLKKWRAEKSWDFICGQHDGYNPATVKREILFIKGEYWIVRDTLISSVEHRVDVRFHYDSQAGTSLKIECFGNGRWIEEEGFVSHCYGQKEAAKALSFSATLKGGAEVVSFLLPQKPGTDWLVNEIKAEEGRAFEVHGAKAVDLVIIPFAGAWVWTRGIDGALTEKVTIE